MWTFKYLSVAALGNDGSARLLLARSHVVRVAGKEFGSYTRKLHLINTHMHTCTRRCRGQARGTHRCDFWRCRVP